MNLELENQKRLDEIIKKLTSIENQVIDQNWLDLSDAAKYICYSKESIRKMIKSGEFINGIHYYKRIKKLIFDKKELDKWVKSKAPKNAVNLNIDETIENILSSINH